MKSDDENTENACNDKEKSLVPDVEPFTQEKVEECVYCNHLKFPNSQGPAPNFCCANIVLGSVLMRVSFIRMSLHMKKIVKILFHSMPGVKKIAVKQGNIHSIGFQSCNSFQFLKFLVFLFERVVQLFNYKIRIRKDHDKFMEDARRIF